jgi:hypothetical protein
MHKPNAKMKNVKCGSASNARQTTNAPSLDYIWMALALLFLILLNFAEAKTFKCTAGSYTKVIEAVNGFVDYEYPAHGMFWKWHIENPEKPNELDDWLLLTDLKNNYPMIYPAKCKEYRGE